MTKFKYILNLLLLTTLTMIDTFLSGYKRKNKDNEIDSSRDNDGSSKTEKLCKSSEREK